jgi:glycosyltransferase involved in cell wall biosynthesis
MTILHVVPAVPFGGMQRIAALLAAAQRDSGVDAHVLAIYDGPAFHDLLVRHAVPHTFLRGSRPSFRSVQHYQKVLARDPSIVHVHGGLLWSNTIALFTKRSPIVYHAHNYPSPNGSLKMRLLSRINRLLVDAIIAVSKDVEHAWRATGISSVVECVYNGIERPNTLRPTRTLISEPVFGMATRLTRDKGIFEFLDVAEAINAQHFGARFVIAGEGSERGELEREASHRRLSKVFHFPGYVADLDAFWSDIDIALFTAAKEPFGLRILESMAHRVAVAAYLTGAGSDEILRPGVTAVTAKYGDVATLAQKAVALCRDQSLYSQITSAAYDDIATRFSVTAMRDGVARVYDQLIRARIR